MVARQNLLCQTVAGFLVFLIWGILPVEAETQRGARGPKSEAPPARVVSVNGVVTRGGQPLKPGDALSVGDVVRAFDDGGAKLLLADDSVVDVGSNSSFRIEAFVPNGGPDREVTLGVDEGKVRASIKKKLEGRGKFLIRTRASVLAVRGTELAVDVSGSSDETNESVWVREGTVTVDTVDGKSPVSIPPGRRYQARVTRSGGVWSIRPGDSRVNPVSTQELEGFFSGATVADRSFLQSVVIEPSDRNFRGRQTYQVLSAAFTAPPQLPAGWRGDPSQLLRDHTPVRRDGAISLRRRGADRSIDIGGANVSDVDVSVIFSP